MCESALLCRVVNDNLHTIIEDVVISVGRGSNRYCAPVTDDDVALRRRRLGQMWTASRSGGICGWCLAKRGRGREQGAISLQGDVVAGLLQHPEDGTGERITTNPPRSGAICVDVALNLAPVTIIEGQ